MQLSKTGYYSDFVVYPAIILVLATTELRPPESVGQLEWLITCVVGITGWTLAEYLIHRFVFHRLPIVSRMHAAHHSIPSALIGAPIWSSVCAFTFGVFIPVWWQAGLNMASGLTSGLMLGYLWYASVHTAVHRCRLDRGSFLYRAKLRHARHHYGKQEEGNFGVTTDFWDLLFGTAIRS
jgi:sterol desaturase/sphingolipid hydroxylase (fatty acid hydroxylase superfamily)